MFTVTTDAATPGYFAIANVDFYDGAGWSFDRTFRPSGGVLPADTDPALRPTARAHAAVPHRRTDRSRDAPWMPFVYRAQTVTGQAVNIDPASGMIVPLGTAQQPARPTRCARAPRSTTFDQVRARTASPDTATSTIDTQLPGTLRATLDEVVHALSPGGRTLRRRRRCRSCRRCNAICARNYTLSNAARGRRDRDGVAVAVAQPDLEVELEVRLETECEAVADAHAVEQREREQRLRRRHRIRRRPGVHPRPEPARNSRAVRDPAGPDRP